MGKMPVDIGKVKEYYTLVQSGTTKANAVRQVFGRTRAKAWAIEKTDEYRMVANAMDQSLRAQLKEEVAELQRKKIQAYGHLLEKGVELIDGSEGEDQFKAQENQRRNLASSVIEEAETWNGDHRNQQEPSDTLEGIIIE